MLIVKRSRHRQTSLVDSTYMVGRCDWPLWRHRVTWSYRAGATMTHAGAGESICKICVFYCSRTNKNALGYRHLFIVVVKIKNRLCRNFIKINIETFQDVWPGKWNQIRVTSGVKSREGAAGSNPTCFEGFEPPIFEGHYTMYTFYPGNHFHTFWVRKLPVTWTLLVRFDAILRDNTSKSVL